MSFPGLAAHPIGAGVVALNQLTCGPTAIGGAGARCGVCLFVFGGGCVGTVAEIHKIAT